MDVRVELELGGRSRTVGRLLDAEQRIYFEYDRAFLATGLELSPFKLPLRPGVFDVGRPEFHGLPGLFYDSLPDGWGLMILLRGLRQRGIDAQRVSPLVWLRAMGRRGLGALSYHPIESRPAAPRVEVELRKLEAQAQAVHRGTARRLVPELELMGGSPGGARPKVVVALGPKDAMVAGAEDLPPGFEHWLVKFSARDDLADAGVLEEVYARLARAAGIDLPPTRLFVLGRGRRCFGVQRFDRGPQGRLHVHSAAGLLHSDPRLPALDYRELLLATQRLTRDQRQVLELFRRAAFNALANNRDDHARNFSFVMDASGRWRLSPAYDLTWSQGMRGHHNTSFLGETERPSREHLLRLAAEAKLSPRAAAGALRKVERAIAGFSVVAKAVGLSARTTDAVERSLKA